MSAIVLYSVLSFFYDFIVTTDLNVKMLKVSEVQAQQRVSNIHCNIITGCCMLH